MVDIMGSIGNRARSMLPSKEAAPESDEFDALEDELESPSQANTKKTNKALRRQKDRSLKPIFLSVAGLMIIGLLGTSYYLKGDRVFGSNAPFTARYFKVKANQERVQAAQAVKEGGLSSVIEPADLTQEPTQSSSHNYQAPLETVMSLQAPLPNEKSTNGASQSTSSYAPPMPQTKENEYVIKINNLMQQVAIMENTIAIQQRKMDTLERKSERNRQDIATTGSSVRSIQANSQALRQTVTSAKSSAEAAESTSVMVRRDVDTLLTEARRNSNDIIEAKVNIANTSKMVDRLDSAYQEKWADLNDKVVEASTLLKNKSHIETTPRKISYLNGQSVTTTDPNYNVQQLRSYGAKVNSDHVVEDYVLISSVNGRHLIRHASGADSWVTIGSSIGRGGVYGVVQDFMPPSASSPGYLKLSNGYRIYDMGRG